MAVNQALTEYLTTASSNTPAGTDPVGTDLDDHLRDMKKNIRNASNFAVQALKDAAYSTVLTDHHTVLRFDCSASAQTVSLLAAATAGDGYTIAVQKAKGANAVVIDANLSETVDGNLQLSLTASAQSVILVCDGSNYHSIGRDAFKIDDELSISAFSVTADLMRVYSSNETDFRKASLLNVFNAIPLNAKIKTGSYTGDGSTSFAITGVGFQPKLLYIIERKTGDGQAANARWTSDVIIDDNASGQSFTQGGNSSTGRILTLDADGFTVSDGGSDGAPNTSGQVYNYYAIG